MPKTLQTTPMGQIAQVSPTERVLSRHAKVRHTRCVVVGDRYVKTVIEDRRAELGVSQLELCQAADISLSTLQRIFKGHVPLPKQARALERALGWERGGLDDAFAERRPKLSPDADPWPQHFRTAPEAPAEQAEPEVTLDDVKKRLEALQEEHNELLAMIGKMERQEKRKAL